MKIEIEIPKEFEGDYNEDKFKDFFGRVLCDIKDGVLCGKYEAETAEMFMKAFAESKVAYDVEAKVAELEVLHDLVNMNQKLAVSQAISIVRGKE